MNMQVNGVEITPQIAEMLKKWFDFNPVIERSVPERYFEHLCDIQDFLCRLLDEEEYREDAIKYISDIIFMKDDFKQLIPKEQES